MKVPEFFFAGWLPTYAKGHLKDTTVALYLENAGVAVVNAKDSILAGLGWTSREGAFVIRKLSPGKYFLLVSFPGYADYTEPFELSEIHPLHDFGELHVLSKSKLLKEVVVRGQTSLLKINGDTTEFNARALKVPGMILGVALPHEHVNWFATNVIAEPLAVKKWQVPAKGRQVTFTQLVSFLNGIANNINGMKQIPRQHLY